MTQLIKTQGRSVAELRRLYAQWVVKYDNALDDYDIGGGDNRNIEQEAKHAAPVRFARRNIEILRSAIGRRFAT